MGRTRKIGLYGGTFSPPHNGHVHAALSFYEQLDLDMLYIIPSFIPPHKQIDNNDDPQHRLEMTKLAFSSHADYGTKIIVSDVELTRGGKSYTAETLKFFKDTIPGDLYFLCGTDMILSMDTWYNPSYIFEAATIVYARRETDRTLDLKIEEKIQKYRDEFGGNVLSLNLEVYPMASTDVRNLHRSGKSIEELVPASVLDYIKHHDLYVE